MILAVIVCLLTLLLAVVIGTLVGICRRQDQVPCVLAARLLPACRSRREILPSNQPARLDRPIFKPAEQVLRER